MKTKLCLMAFIAIVTLQLTSCSSVQNGVRNRNASAYAKTNINSANEYDLNIASESVSYTIDISTPEGKAKLQNLTLRQAEDLALTEAVIKNKCALLFNPQYTHLKKGKHVLRVTVYGFPATYKNQK